VKAFILDMLRYLNRADSREGRGRVYSEYEVSYTNAEYDVEVPGSGLVTPSGYAVFPRQNSVLVGILLSISWSWYDLESGVLYRGSWRHG
jgi:hypothetical protein